MGQLKSDMEAAKQETEQMYDEVKQTEKDIAGVQKTAAEDAAKIKSASDTQVAKLADDLAAERKELDAAKAQHESTYKGLVQKEESSHLAAKDKLLKDKHEALHGSPADGDDTDAQIAQMQKEEEATEQSLVDAQKQAKQMEDEAAAKAEQTTRLQMQQTKSLWIK